MKKTRLFLVVVIMITSNTLTAQVAVEKIVKDPDNSAVLELQGNSKGFLPTRLTQAERDAISNPAEGLVIYNTTTNCLEFYTGIFWHRTCGTPEYQIVTNPSTGESWLDRNLGASQVATSSIDALAYGDLYQWGRYSEGHEDRSSGTTSTNATTAVPNAGNPWDGLFITEDTSPYDWLVPQDNTLWQGVSGTNNPCPSGFRIPTTTELDAERSSWSSNNAIGAYNSPLKLTVGGYRSGSSGLTSVVNEYGMYWSSTTVTSYAQLLSFELSAGITINDRDNGISVRCIQD